MREISVNELNDPVRGNSVLDKLKKIVNRTFKNTMKQEVDEALRYQNALKVKIDSNGIYLDLESFLKNDEVTEQAKKVSDLKVS
jgi:hypothetical protein